jgi:hypothetical protein
MNFSGEDAVFALPMAERRLKLAFSTAPAQLL